MRHALVVGLAMAMAAVWTPAAAQTEDPVAAEFDKFREVLEQDNPAELWEIKGEQLWKSPGGPNKVSLEKCDLGLGPGVVKGAYAQMPRYFADVDRVMVEFGLPMGPFAMGDLAGLDVGWRIRKQRGLPRPGERYSSIGDRLCELGRFGQKTGKGYYKYEGGSRSPLPDPDVEKLIEETLQKLGKKRRNVSDEEILERMMYPMVNEGARILEEGIAARPSDIDVIWLYGYGWPIYRGGPMFWADSVGLKHIADRLSYYARETNDPSLEPAPLLKRLAASGGTFASLAAPSKAA